jgi:hypothetical protein
MPGLVPLLTEGVRQGICQLQVLRPVPVLIMPSSGGAADSADEKTAVPRLPVSRGIPIRIVISAEWILRGSLVIQ